MSDCSTLIRDIIRDRLERGIGDLLLSAYDAGYSAGAGIACEAATHPGLADLLSTIAMRHQSEVLALRQWSDPAIRADDLPGWLLAQRERDTALDGTTPPDGWRIGGWPV